MLPSIQSLENTAQSFPPKNSIGPGPMIYDVQRGPILPPRGTKERDRQLRLYDAFDYNSIWQSARAGITKKIAAVTYEIEGPPNVAQYYHDVLGYSHFGHGWEYMTKLVLRDFFTQSYGGIWEIAGPGDPNTPLFSQPTGINHLDASRCYVTGNPIYPIVYYSLWDGKMHKMHGSRVYMMVDDPIPDERYFGIGTSALERAISIVQREMRMSQYVDALLDDKPQPGILALSGLSDDNWQALVNKYMMDQSADERPTFGRVLVLTSVDPNANVKAQVIPFSQTPEKFDFIRFTDLDVNSLALAFGVDRQELWELGGRGVGSGSQSQILAMKSRSKLYADVLGGMERFMNWAILPDSCEFKFKEHDQQQDQIQAAIDVSYAQVANTLVTSGYDKAPITQLLADKSDTFKDAFTDEKGRLQLPGDVRQDPAQIKQEVSLESNTPIQAAGTNPQASNAAVGQGQQATPKSVPAATQPTPVKTQPTGAGVKPVASVKAPGISNLITTPKRGIQLRSKAYSTTKAEFAVKFANILESAVLGSLSRTQAESMLMGLLLSSGQKAFQDGLEEGGVLAEEMDEEDEQQVQDFVADNLDFMDSMLDRAYAGDIPIDAIQRRAAMWANKSLTEIYNAGQISGNRNGYYRWQLGQTEKHCEDCERLNGQVHRFKQWYNKGWLPQSNKLECGGFNCDCRLVKDEGPGWGRFSYNEGAA